VTAVLSLFSDVGGLDLAVCAVTGGRLIAHVESDPAAARVLNRHWPDVPNLSDITAVDWTSLSVVDVVCGGFPCQDISTAGRGAGIGGARSGLWTEMAAAVRALRPRLVFLENVAAILARGVDVVAADLAAVGYDLRWTCLRASDIGAPHRRDRWFAIAYPQRSTSRESHGHAAIRGRARAPEQARLGSVDTTADANGAGGETRNPVRLGVGGRTLGTGVVGGSSTLIADPTCDGRATWRPESDGRLTATDAQSLAWGDFEPAIRRWERLTGVAAPRPTDDRARLSPEFVEWMVGLPTGWTDVGISRSQRLRCLGNIAMPQQAQVAYGQLLSGAAV
jgi:DNA (cytosine-5)-methyltransferase 1